MRQDVERLHRKGKMAKYSMCAHVSLGRHTCVHACTCAWTCMCVKAETQKNKDNENQPKWASLVAKWWRIYQPTKETQVGSLIWEDALCRAEEHLCPRATPAEPPSSAQGSQPWSPAAIAPEPPAREHVLQEGPPHRSWSGPARPNQRESPSSSKDSAYPQQK